MKGGIKLEFSDLNLQKIDIFTFSYEFMNFKSVIPSIKF